MANPNPISRLGARVLDKEGRWLCPQNHNKEEVGVYQGFCVTCANEWKTNYRRRQGYKTPGYRGDPMHMPNLRHIREGLGISQAEFARRAGINTTSLSYIERGIRKAGYTTRRKILATLTPILAAQKRYGYR